MSYKDKIKCFFGFHDWEYNHRSSEVPKLKFQKNYNFGSFGQTYQDLYDSFVIRYPNRFCNRCFKKQIKVRYDMRIIWEDSDNLTLDEIRQKKLKNLLNE